LTYLIKIIIFSAVNAVNEKIMSLDNEGLKKFVAEIKDTAGYQSSPHLQMYVQQNVDPRIIETFQEEAVFKILMDVWRQIKFLNN
jgi:hypothetical protein